MSFCKNLFERLGTRSNEPRADRIKRSFVILLLLVPLRSAFTQTVETPLSSWSYDLLDHFRGRGLLEVGTFNTRPLTKSAMTKALLSLHKNTNARLSHAERERLEYLLFEFSEEAQRLDSSAALAEVIAKQRRNESRLTEWLPRPLYNNGRNFFAWQERGLRFYFDPLLYRDGTFNDTDTLAQQDRVAQSTNGFIFWGALGKRLGFYFNSRDTKEFGTRTYPASSRLAWPRYGYARGYGSHVYHDETVAYLYFALPYVEVEVGKNFNRWGPGRSGSLALNDYATSYDQIKLVAQFWRAQFTYLHATLRQHPPVLTNSYFSNGVERQIFANKYLAAHRLEVAPMRWLNFALHETVIYSERGVELAYLNPIMFYRSAEHFLGDRDNATIGADLEVRPLPGLRVYGELFIDDLAIARLSEHWYGNKVAWLAGAHFASTLGRFAHDLRAEYVRLAPYVYSHTFPINVYKHYNTMLGHPLGPNAEAFYFEWLLWGGRHWQALGAAEHARHGANPPDRNVGGDVDRAFHVRDNQTVYFFDGIVERRTRLRLEARYEVMRNLRVKLAVERSRFQNAPATAGRREAQTYTIFLALGLNAED